MRYTTFGRRSGLRVSEYALGTGNFGTAWVSGTNAAESTGRRTAVLDEVLAVAKETGASVAQVSMAWLRERGERSAATLIPIVGPRTQAQLDDYLGALDVPLTDEQYTRLDEVSAVELGVPHGIDSQIRECLLGGDASRFVSPVVPIA
jgi:aryl-alcohol dehydrogenase-like predicted oxidoreductase